MKQLLSKADVAKMLGCCPRSVDNLRSTAGLPFHNIGRLVRFDEAEVRNWAGLTPVTINTNNDSEKEVYDVAK